MTFIYLIPPYSHQGGTWGVLKCTVLKMFIHLGIRLTIDFLHQKGIPT